MPLLPSSEVARDQDPAYFCRRSSVTSVHSPFAQMAIMNNMGPPPPRTPEASPPYPTDSIKRLPSVAPSSTYSMASLSRTSSNESHSNTLEVRPGVAHRNGKDGYALSDTPAPTAPNSPTILPRKNSNEKVRNRPTTLDIPGLTRSRVSPDGRIAQRDVGSKLVIVMVGLPARGKSYITKKMARYLNWLQHDTRIFNVGERRRIAAGGPAKSPVPEKARLNGLPEQTQEVLPTPLANIMVNGESTTDHLSKTTSQNFHNPSIPTLAFPELRLPGSEMAEAAEPLPAVDGMDQSANFFDPSNAKGALIREQCAIGTLDDLLDYILEQGGSVGILDATNSTLERRKLVIEHIRERAGPDLNVLFIESVCVDDNLLERNMRLKLSGPDYKDKDPEASLADFKMRVKLYEQKYVPLGEYEEKNNMPYVQMVDVGRKIISHQIRGFLSAQAVYYLLNFNLAPRQIWITRHGQSMDNINGKIGGDSKLTKLGQRFSGDLHKFVAAERLAWELREIQKERNAHLPPSSGDTTPPNPHYAAQYGDEYFLQKNFCVWTSMLNRSIETAEYFENDDDFDMKQMRMLNELYAGDMEGLTYEEIKTQHQDQYEERRKDKLHYRYPGPGGEGYLDVINRLRPVIVELERMTDHCLLIAHRSVARILLAYFKGLDRSEVAELDVPLGMLYCLEPKPYGVDFKAYRYNTETDWFDYEPDYQLRRAPNPVD